jgi:arsenate reductase (glutaredoxin)
MSVNSVIVYHYPKCRRSRAGLELLQKKGFDIKIREYFKAPFTEKELEDVLMRLNKKPIELVRTKEHDFLTKFRNKVFTDREWIMILIENPHLIRRPIIVKGLRAIIGEKPEDFENF